MIEWLETNAVWIGALGAIVGIAVFIWSLIKRDKAAEPRKTIVANRQSVAADRIDNSPINISSDVSGKTDD